MTPSGSDRRAPTWQWVAVTALTIVGGLGLFMITDARTSIIDLQKNKLDKSEYYQDITEIKDMFREIRQDVRDHDRKVTRKTQRDEE